MEFSTLHRNVEEIIDAVANSKARYDAGDAAIDSINTVLNDLPTQYSGTNTEVTAGAAANPSDPAWQNLEAEMLLAFADRNTVKDMVTAVQTCFNKIEQFDAATVQAALDAIA